MNKTCSGGYTLIEILTVVVIMALIFGVSYPNFRGYQQRQQALSYGRELESHLFEAQQLALIGNKPTGGPCSLDNKTFEGIIVFAPLPVKPPVIPLQSSVGRAQILSIVE